MDPRTRLAWLAFLALVALAFLIAGLEMPGESLTRPACLQEC